MLRTVRDSAEKFGRKVMWLNARLRANNHEALNEIAHLAHIPRPGIAQEDVHGRSAQLASLLAVGRTEFVEEIAGQRGDVLLALSQRRHKEGDDIEPVKKILAKCTARDFLLEILIRGRDDARVHGDRLAGTHRFKSLLFQNAKHL